MPRITARVSVLVVILLGMSAGDRSLIANPHPPDPEPRLVTADSLLEALNRSDGAYRTDAEHQLRLLGESDLEVLRAAAQIPKDDVRRAAFSALATIGTDGAILILRDAFQDGTLSNGVRIAAAEALGDARDFAWIPMLEDAARRSTDPHFPRFVRKAIRRMSAPDFDRPIMVFEDGHLWYRFLREEVASVVLSTYRNEVRHTFRPSEARAIFDLLSESAESNPGEIITMDNLKITLRDGRKALLWISGSNFAYDDTSRYWQRSGFVVSNAVLKDYIWMTVGSGPRGPG